MEPSGGIEPPTDALEERRSGSAELRGHGSGDKDSQPSSPDSKSGVLPIAPSPKISPFTIHLRAISGAERAE